MDNKISKKKNINYVYLFSLAITAMIAIWAIVAQDSFEIASNATFKFLTTDFGWLYLASMTFFVIFVVALAISKYGSIKLGADDSVPEHSNFAWFAMLFSAGMGVGLVFWGVAEPMAHFVAPIGAEPGSVEAAQFAMETSFMHWGIHPWANYCVIGLSLAYFQYRRNKKGLISCVFAPLIGERRTDGWIGKMIDILAIFATVAGVTTSLGLGVLQINSGVNYLFGIPNTLLVQIIIIIVITVIYIWSGTSGIDRGIKMLSKGNLALAMLLLAVAFLVGPKLKILNSITDGIGKYFGTFIQDSMYINAYGDNSWVSGWRVFYWAWWIAWAPFVGSFIARISKGRTIREFIIGVVLVPMMGSVLWFGVFGTLAINLSFTEVIPFEAMKTLSTDPSTTLFVVMNKYPLGSVLSLIAVLLLCTFFITSADSGTFVLSTFSSDGNLDPPNSKKILWGTVQSTLAIGLLIAGGLTPLQTISICAAFPFIFIMLFACLSLFKVLRNDEYIK